MSHDIESSSIIMHCHDCGISFECTDIAKTALFQKRQKWLPRGCEIDLRYAVG